MKIEDQVWDGSLPLKIQKPDPTAASIAAFLAQPMAAEFHTQVSKPAKVITVAEFLKGWSDATNPKMATFLKFFKDNEENLKNGCSRPGFCTTDQTQALDTFFSDVNVVQKLNQSLK